MFLIKKSFYKLNWIIFRPIICIYCVSCMTNYSFLFKKYQHIKRFLIHPMINYFSFFTWKYSQPPYMDKIKRNENKKLLIYIDSFAILTSDHQIGPSLSTGDLWIICWKVVYHSLPLHCSVQPNKWKHDRLLLQIAYQQGHLPRSTVYSWTFRKFSKFWGNMVILPCYHIPHTSLPSLK